MANKKEEVPIFNPFSSPNILDRRIEVFTACNACNKPFISSLENASNISKATYNDVYIITCMYCGTVYKFRNWNPKDRLGLNSNTEKG